MSSTDEKDTHGAHHDHGADHAHVFAADVDVLEITTKRPYKEVGFIFTYIAACLGALAAYGGFVMPATSLALINLDIGMHDVHMSEERCV